SSVGTAVCAVTFPLPAVTAKDTSTSFFGFPAGSTALTVGRWPRGVVKNSGTSWPSPSTTKNCDDPLGPPDAAVIVKGVETVPAESVTVYVTGVFGTITSV